MEESNSPFKASAVVVVICLTMISTALPRAPVGQAFGSSSIIIVGPGQSIAQAVSLASAGDTLLVKSGFYSETMIVVNKTLSIVGESAENTIVDGGKNAQIIFQILADNVLIENLTVQNTDTSVQVSALTINGVVGVTVMNVTVLSAAYGIELRSSNFSQVSRCRISGCSYDGIFFRDMSTNNVIVGNTIANNSVGVGLADTASQGNKVYHNNFENNTQQVSSLGGMNFFDKGYPSGGNFWSDYVSVDLKSGPNQDQNGSDGILDQRFSFDNYPLASPLTNIDIQVLGQDYNVETSANISFSGCSFNVSGKNLQLFFGGQQAATSVVRVEIPKNLLSCDNLSSWTVYVQNDSLKSLQYLGMEDLASTYLYFAFNNSDGNRIEIVGTRALPEVSFSVMIGLLMVTGLAAILLKKRLKKQ